MCLLDLEYGLPVQVRDTALGIDTTDAIPKSDVNREYFAEEHDKKVSESTRRRQQGIGQKHYRQLGSSASEFEAFAHSSAECVS